MILTLCGSARFEPFFRFWNEVLSLAGHAVFDLAVPPSHKNGVKDWYTPKEKEMLDVVHKRKIDASDAIVVINMFSYIGESTLSEINHAMQQLKPLYFVESWGKGQGPQEFHGKGYIACAKAFGCEGTKSPIATTNLIGKRSGVVDLIGPPGEIRNNNERRIREFDRILMSGLIQPTTNKENSNADS